MLEKNSDLLFQASCRQKGLKLSRAAFIDPCDVRMGYNKYAITWTVSGVSFCRFCLVYVHTVQEASSVLGITQMCPSPQTIYRYPAVQTLVNIK
jgi:hypothetical protein